MITAGYISTLHSMTLYPLKNHLLWQRHYSCGANFMSAQPCGWGQRIKMKCRMTLDKLIPWLERLVLERWQLPLWWQTHKLCRADCKQKKVTGHVTQKLLIERVNMSACQCQNICFLPYCYWSITAPVGIVDYCVEGLIDPLPEQHSWSRPTRCTTVES